MAGYLIWHESDVRVALWLLILTSLSFPHFFQFADSCGIRFLETSAKGGQNVTDAFQMLASDIKVKMERRMVRLPFYSIKPLPSSNPFRMTRFVGTPFFPGRAPLSLMI